MKKLILSAVFALACFTAQANDNISNDDKNPKSKIKVVMKLQAATPRPAECCMSAQMQGNCDTPTVFAAYVCASDCQIAFLRALGRVLMGVC